MTASDSPFLRLVDDPSLDEFDAALMVAKLLTPDLDEVRPRTELEALCAAFAGQPAPSAASLCAFMREQGFAGATDDYYDLGNSAIDRVLDRRSGIPITLAVLYVAVARSAGLGAVGINYPGHFLVQVEAELIDPFHGELTDRSTCESQLEASGYDGPLGAAFRPAAARDLALRMLNNVRAVLTERRQWAAALDVVDHQQVLAPGEVQLDIDRARLWLAAGAPDMARSVLVAARERHSEPETRRLLERHLERLPDAGPGPVVH
jgi:regulator of sirC expression with transglutaminase-like and TPR domain